MAEKNKVKFNLKNCHVAPITADGTYGTIFAIPGAVSLSPEPQGDIEKFYADGVVYYQSAPNNGYEGDLELALVTDEFREKIFKEVPIASGSDNAGYIYENVNNKYADFAFGFQIDGDSSDACYWFFNGTATRPTLEASTLEDSKTPQTEKLTMSFAADSNGDVRAKAYPANVATFFASVPTRVSA